MKKPTDKQIAAEIAALKKLKPRLRKSSVFGDDHHAAVDAQIAVLEERLSDGKIYDRFESTGFTDIDHGEGRGDNVLSAAIDAQQWRDGDKEDKPSSEWRELTT
jgi:hypothetical protein